MSRNVMIKFSDGYEISGSWGGKCTFPGNFAFKPGDVCLIEPPNSQKKKHRGRQCRLLDAYTKFGTVRVLFLDSNTRGTVDVSDLVPVP